jgi:hypothetical protein
MSTAPEPVTGAAQIVRWRDVPAGSVVLVDGDLAAVTEVIPVGPGDYYAGLVLRRPAAGPAPVRVFRPGDSLTAISREN